MGLGGQYSISGSEPSSSRMSRVSGSAATSVRAAGAAFGEGCFSEKEDSASAAVGCWCTWSFGLRVVLRCCDFCCGRWRLVGKGWAGVWKAFAFAFVVFAPRGAR